MQGVYAIVCLPTGERYVGSAVNLARRWDRHKRELSANKHHSWKLQRAWAAHGESAFVFSVLDLVENSSQLLAVEQERISEAFAAGKALNILPTAGSTRGSTQTEETKKKRSNAMRGHTVSEETKNKIRERAKGRRASEKTKDRMRAARKKVKVSESTKDKQRVPIERVCSAKDEVVFYPSIKAVKEHGFNPSSVSNVLAGRKREYKGFFWRYATEKRGCSWRHARRGKHD